MHFVYFLFVKIKGFFGFVLRVSIKGVFYFIKTFNFYLEISYLNPFLVTNVLIGYFDFD